MMRRMFVSATALAVLLLLATPVFADVWPSLRVVPSGFTGPTRAGEPLTFEIELIAGQAVMIEDIRFDADRFNGITHDAPSTLMLPMGGQHTIQFSATPTDDDLGVDFRYTVNGFAVVKRIDLSRAHWDLVKRSQETIPMPELDALPPFPSAATMAMPGLLPLAPRAEGRKPVRDMSQAGTNRTLSHDVRVRGRFMYMREDGQWLGVDGVTVRIYDEDFGFDEYLGGGLTNAFGSFDFVVSASEGEPDIYCELETSNNRITVEDGSLTEDNYFFYTHVKEDFTGTDINYGAFSIANNSLMPALHIMTNGVRAWRWLADRGYDTPYCEFQWPDGDWAYYDGEVNLPNQVGTRAFRWATDTHVHEYGHHVMDAFMYTEDPDYENGVCDSPDRPGHCQFCEETGHDAVGEGWPNWLADVVTRSYASDYGLASDYTRNQENIGVCEDSNDNACDCDPYKTEGFIGRLFRDLEDNSPNEDDPNAPGSWKDQLTLGTDEILHVMTAFNITSPGDFISNFASAHPEVNRELFWETAMNAGYQSVDTQAPSPPTNFTSTSHFEGLGFDSPDGTIALTWTRATDDWSGVSGYSIRAGPTAEMPDQVAEVGDVTTGLAAGGFGAGLSVGTYWITIRTRDRAGRWSPTFATTGPYVIREPIPADFTSVTPTGWDFHLVPRDHVGATATNTRLTTTLPGNMNDTFWNLAGRNYGELQSAEDNRCRLLLDGVPVDSVTFGPIDAMSLFQVRNQGPLVVRGGRHTLEAWYDAAEENAETNEDDNRKGIQFVWTPWQMEIGTKYQRVAPPIKNGGWNSFTVPIGFPKWFNVDGLHYSHFDPRDGMTHDWSAVYAFSVDDDGDVDLMLHPESTFSQDGFTDGISTSARAEGQIDAVFTSTVNLVSDSWDVGVVNFDGNSADYVSQHLVGFTKSVGDSIVVTLDADEMMALYKLNVTSGNTGKIAIAVVTDSTDAPITTLWMDEDFTFGNLNSFDAKTTTGSNGRSLLSIDVPTTGSNGLAFYRHPRDGRGPLTFGVKVFQKTPDVAPAKPPGWYATLTPRPAADGMFGFVPQPGFLYGDDQDTYFNISVQNLSDILLNSVFSQVSVDETNMGAIDHLVIAGGWTVERINELPGVVPAGRHVLTLTIDPDDVLSELNEFNNSFAEQWVWSPPEQALGVPVWREGTNGSKITGWSLVDPLQPLFFNCDGIRSSDFVLEGGHHWAGFAVTPRPGSDVDLGLFEKASSAKNGFSEPLESSDWGDGATDFVLVNFLATGYRGFDAGILRATDDTASYVTQIVGLTSHEDSSDTYGPFIMGVDEVLKLHSFNLGAGAATIRLNNLGGTVDWGISVYDSERPYQNREAGSDIASQWFAGPGESEVIGFDVPASGNFCVAVWKIGATEIGKAGGYTLIVNSENLDAGTQPAPNLTRLAGAAPNPLRERTLVAFDAATAGAVKLEVFDLRGARIRLLADRPFEAGRHQIPWDGRDEAGRAVPAGLYMVRLVAAGHSDAAKLVRIE